MYGEMNKKLAKLIRVKMEMKNISQSELARQMGRSRQSVSMMLSRLESGKSINTTTYKLLDDILGLD